MDARIYRPVKTAMQSGRAGTTAWVLEFEPAERKRHDPLMGWVGSGDMRQQTHLRFATREQAVAYAESHGLAYALEEPRARHSRPKTYADNFRWDRPD
jgi:hypothetical protein